MDLDKVLLELMKERDLVDQAIASLERLSAKQPRTPKRPLADAGGPPVNLRGNASAPGAGFD